MVNRSRLKSYVCHGRATAGQRRAFKEFLTRYQLKKTDGYLQFTRNVPRYLEIGFGNGQSLLALAEQRPEHDFIAIEAHKPGIGALCLGLAERQLHNVRVFHGDAVEILKDCVADETFDGIQLFFPDPWPKRRHHQRRIIQADFVSLLATKLKKGGQLDLATDWQDYAMHMLKVLSNDLQFQNAYGKGNFASRSPLRPIITKFEKRAIESGRCIFDLSFTKI